ncbi:MAG: hypothetical protein EB047_08255 [Chitinophagaceae bacterium]|nr:hypothetical protein [Chitinophagaceae bacterium]
MPGFIDTHTHLYLEEFDNDRSVMLERARLAGVNQFYLPAIDSATHDALITMETTFPFCKAMMGVHPCSIKENYQEELAIAQQYWEKRNFVAVAVIENIDLAHLVLETDAPYLTPVPHRGKRNESSYIPLIAEKIAEVKGVKVEEVAQITTQNAENLFR